MLIAENAAPFDDPHFIYEIKWDGERCIAYLDVKEKTTELRNKRNMIMNPKAPELLQLHRQVKKKCILDGELMVLVDGKPNFYEIQRHNLMSNPFRLELAARKYPATFVAFDCLWADGQDLTLRPLMERKRILKQVVKENERIVVSRYFEGKGAALFSLARQQGLERIVAKRKDSIYIQGKRSKDWLKIKNLQDEDFVVCGYIRKDNHMTSLVLGQYVKTGGLVYKGQE